MASPHLTETRGFDLLRGSNLLSLDVSSQRALLEAQLGERHAERALEERLFDARKGGSDRGRY